MHCASYIHCKLASHPGIMARYRAYLPVHIYVHIRLQMFRGQLQAVRNLRTLKNGKQCAKW
jgi:hypothetical protein